LNLTDTLRWLVDIPSVTGDEGRICTQVAARMAETVGEPQVTRVGRSVVVGKRAERPLVVLAGHLDTVPSQGQEAAEVREGRLYGLGAADMKAGLAVMIGLLEDPAVRLGPYDVVGVFYAGEEGPSDGNELEAVLTRVPWLAEASLAVVMEPSDNEIQLGCNGVVNARVVFEGRPAHSARPWLGENAISKAGALLAELHLRQPEPVTFEGLVYQSVISVTKAHGGVATNIVPGRFELTVNYRFTPDLSIKQAEERLKEICAAADIVEILDSAPAGMVHADHPLVGELSRVSGAARTAKQGWTDVARFSLHGIPSINYGPGETAQAHQPGESVAVADLDRAYSNLRRVLLG
jgi:succinyl-diaminopimelate desuccinylase